MTEPGSKLEQSHSLTSKHEIPWIGTRRSPKRGIQFMRTKIIDIDLIEESNFVQSLKNRYKKRYPQLNSVPDNLWEIIDFYVQ
jgi:hypothetical protein